MEEIAAAPFERWAFLHLLHHIAATRPADGEDGIIELDGGARTLRLRRGEDFFARAFEAEGVQGTPFGLTVGPVILELGAPGG